MDGNFFDFFANLHEKYEENASKWSLDFTQQDFLISGELIQNLDLIEMMEKVRKIIARLFYFIQIWIMHS